MQLFKLPEFYVPWPARLNPNLAAARAHSKVWAREVGILEDGGIWSESAFDRHDYALLCAYIHPEAPADELNLMTDWNIWAFYVDDFFLQVYKQANDHDGGKKYLDRVLLFMPVGLSLLSAPTNPMERALANLWLRTAPTKSEAWRARIIESTRSLLDAFMWELDSMSQKRLANPIEYIEIRRQVGAALWSADLVEHAMFVEIPERIAATRPIQALKNTFADGVHLRNDIFSYEREVLKEGELTNAVLVVERFLNVNTQHAADLVNDLLTSRLQEFEHIVLTQLAEIFQEYALNPLEQMNVLHYIRGLQDWQSGAHEWHIQTSRYLNPRAAGQTSSSNGFFVPGLPGFSGAAMHITPSTLILGMNRLKKYNRIPYKKVGPVRLPQFYMPFTTSMNPHLEIARQHYKAWAFQMGMLDTVPDCPELFIWDEQKLDVTDLPFFCALAHPDKTIVQLDIEVGWILWGNYTDDYVPAIYGRTRDLIGAKIFFTRLVEFMPVESGASMPVPINPVERGLADLWQRSTATRSVDERRSFRKTIEGMIGSWATWEIANEIQNRIPDPIEYLEMRRKTSGSDQILILPRAIHSQGIPPEVYRTLTMQELNNAAIDYVCLTNDIFSYQKEMEFDGEMHNAVLVIQNFLSCDKAQAVEIANDLMTARMKQFEHIVKVGLPILFKDFNLDVNAREQLLAYVEELQRFPCASLHWHIKTERYKEVEFNRSIRLLTARPTGFGTSAARVLDVIDSPMISNTAKPPQTASTPKTKSYAVIHHTLPFNTSNIPPTGR